MEVKFTDENFATEALQAAGTVLVDFYADWCGPCKAMAPIIEKLAEEYEGKVKVGKLNIDENPETPSQYGIMSIPTLLIIKNGQVADTIVGAVPKGEIVAKLK